MKTYTFTLDNPEGFKIQMLNWANQFNIFCLLDNQAYTNASSPFDCLLAVGCKASLSAPAGSALEQLRQFCEANPSSWLFGHLGYDLKNETEALQSLHPDPAGFPDLFFFEPLWILQIKDHSLVVTAEKDGTELIQEIQSGPVHLSATIPSYVFRPRISREMYLQQVTSLLGHIHRGDCYEINFCQEFFVQPASIDPLAVYQRLLALSPNPFSALYKLNDKYCICASPERFIKKKGLQLSSQPIKGTVKRDRSNVANDQLLRKQLAESEKDKAENVMVVDLVRNDLSRVCIRGSVAVEELFGIYSFPQVHQMISTVSGTMDPALHWTDVIRAAFPMGSMTGAPKKRVMELIEKYECTKRGLFSGAIGYIAPGGDFDFNVVIRSLFYNQQNDYLGFQVGGGITANSNPEQEYEECLLKASAIRACFSMV